MCMCVCVSHYVWAKDSEENECVRELGEENEVKWKNKCWMKERKVMRRGGIFEEVKEDTKWTNRIAVQNQAKIE